MANAEVEPNSSIAVTVSGGPAQVAIPTLVGLTRSEATNALTAAGLVLGTLDTKASDLPADTVLSSDPQEGTLSTPAAPWRSWSPRARSRCPT